MQRHFILSTKLKSVPLQNQLQCLISEITLPAEGLQLRREFLEELTHVLRRQYPKCQVYPFGSTITGLGDRDADIDIYLDLNGKHSIKNLRISLCIYHNILPHVESNFRSCISSLSGITVSSESKASVQYTEDSTETVAKLRKLTNFLKGVKVCGRRGELDIRFCRLVIPIVHTRVPIIRTEHYNGLKCDLSFKNLLSVQNSKMIAFFISLDPRVRPLILLVRYWGHYHDLISGNSIKSYAMVLLVIVFLCIKRIVPSVQFIQNFQNTPPRLCDGWNSAFSENAVAVMKEFKNTFIEPVRNDSLDFTGTILNLAQEFFEMYGETDFQSTVVCSLMGCFIPKENFEPGNEEGLPRALELYKNWSAQQSLSSRLKINASMCVQDPFDLSFNVCGVVKPHLLSRFQMACSKTAKVIDAFLKGDIKGGLLSIFDRVQLPKIKPVDQKIANIEFPLAQKVHKITLSMTQDFKIIFLSNYMGLATLNTLQHKMLSLWMTFMQNMILEVFGKSLELTIKKKFKKGPPPAVESARRGKLKVPSKSLISESSSSSINTESRLSNMSISSTSGSSTSSQSSISKTKKKEDPSKSTPSDCDQNAGVGISKNANKKRSRENASLSIQGGAFVVEKSNARGASIAKGELSNGTSPRAKIVKKSNEDISVTVKNLDIKMKPKNLDFEMDPGMEVETLLNSSEPDIIQLTGLYYETFIFISPN